MSEHNEAEVALLDIMESRCETGTSDKIYGCALLWVTRFPNVRTLKKPHHLDLDIKERGGVFLASTFYGRRTTLAQKMNFINVKEGSPFSMSSTQHRCILSGRSVLKAIEASPRPTHIFMGDAYAYRDVRTKVLDKSNRYTSGIWNAVSPLLDATDRLRDEMEIFEPADLRRDEVRAFFSIEDPVRFEHQGEVLPVTIRGRKRRVIE